MLTAKQIKARIKCVDECARHLKGVWTDDPGERRQCAHVVAWLDREINALVRQKQRIEAKEKFAAAIQNDMKD